jgi:hypothetical protein
VTIRPLNLLREALGNLAADAAIQVNGWQEP